MDDAALVDGIRNGDENCWRELVDRHSDLVWRVARSVVNDDHGATDAMQTAWLRLLENIDRIADPRAVRGWLCTTAKREAMALSKRSARQQPVDPTTWLSDHATDPDDDPSALNARDARDATVLDELAKLGDKCRELLTLIAHKIGYDEIATILEMAIGSIGPTRARCLEQLRSAPAIAALEGAGA